MKPLAEKTSAGQDCIFKPSPFEFDKTANDDHWFFSPNDPHVITCRTFRYGKPIEIPLDIVDVPGQEDYVDVV